MKNAHSLRKTLAKSAIISLLIVGLVRVGISLLRGTDIGESIAIAITGLVIGFFLFLILRGGLWR